MLLRRDEGGFTREGGETLSLLPSVDPYHLPHLAPQCGRRRST